MKINKEGLKIIATTGLIVAIILAGNCLLSIYGLLPMWATILILVAALGLWGFVTAFFREPARPTLTDKEIVFSPCDGEVVVVEQTDELPYSFTINEDGSIVLSFDGKEYEYGTDSDDHQTTGKVVTGGSRLNVRTGAGM